LIHHEKNEKHETNIAHVLARLTKPRNLLWLDLVGAATTAIVTGVVLTTVVVTGLPGHILLALSIVAALYAGFDLCALRFWPNAKWPLATIGCLNLAYCVAATAACLLFHESLTFLGATYFILEACIVVPLAIIEIRSSSRESLGSR
jgi:hypothetical protein